jgi:uncharacterized RDD family membrane protein YckC
MFCPACGTPAGAQDRFCQQCGKPLSAGTSPATGESAPPDSPPSVIPVGGPPPLPPPDTSPPIGPPPLPPPPYYGAPPAYPTYPSSAAPWQNVAPFAGDRLSSFGVPLARWWQRVGSMVLDVLVVGVPLFIVNAILNATFGTERLVRLVNGTYETQRTIQGPAHVVIVIATVAIVGLYYSVLNGTRTGQTIGNRAPGIAVRDVATGEAIGFKRGLLRWFIRFVLYLALLLPGLLNDLFPLWDSRNQTIADKAAHSVVIRLK